MLCCLSARTNISTISSSLPRRASWMRQKENPAMPALPDTPPQLRSAPDDGPQHHVVLPHQRAHLARAVPILAELKMLLDFDDYKPRVSLMMLMFLNTHPRPTRSMLRCREGSGGDFL